MNREKEIEERASEYAQYDAFANCNIDDVWRGFVEGAQWADSHPLSSLITKNVNDCKVNIKIVQGVEGKSCYINDIRVYGNKPWGGGKVIYEAEPSLSDLNNCVFKNQYQLEKSSPWKCIQTDGYPPERLYNKPLLSSDKKGNSVRIDYFNGQGGWKSGVEIEYWMEIPQI